MSSYKEEIDEVYQRPSTSSELIHLNLSNQFIDGLHSRDYEGKVPRYEPNNVVTLNIAQNQFLELPSIVCRFVNIVNLDISDNSISKLPEEIGRLRRLQHLDVRNNHLRELPKSFQQLTDLKTLNLSGNALLEVPNAVMQLKNLKELRLGGNLLDNIPTQISDLTNLEILYLGGNRLTEVPASMGYMKRLTALFLCDNRLDTIPATFAGLQNLSTLALHNNLIRTLPTEIIKLRHLDNLSLRRNPLVNNFVNDMELGPLSLKELAARIVKIKFSRSFYCQILPRELIGYIHSASQCVNPKCKGVYFEACVEHVKFVDFCGMYRVPLLQYLCSPRCTSTVPAYAKSDISSDSEDDHSSPSPIKLKKILLG